MRMRADNLYIHADGGFYCLLSDDFSVKTDDPGTGWVAGVAYIGTDGRMRATSRTRWADRFTRVAEYNGEDESVFAMIRRANPGDSDFDFMQVMAKWHESEMATTVQMLELAIAATAFIVAPRRFDNLRITVTPADLRAVLETFEVERVSAGDGFSIRLVRT